MTVKRFPEYLTAALCCAAMAVLLAACSRGTETDAAKPAPTPDPAVLQAESEPAAQTDAPAAPTPDPAVQAFLDSLTAEEKVAQLFIVTPEALTEISGAATVAGDTTRQAFDTYPVGGVYYRKQNLQNTEQTKQLLSGMQQISRQRLNLPVFLGVDEEGGTVSRVSGNAGLGITAYPDMAVIGAGGDPARAAQIGTEMGQYLSALGFNLDFAPVADVLTNTENTVVRDRSFGSDPQLVTDMAAAVSDGLLAGGVLPCYKHFPGHGSTAEDSHEGFAVSHRTAEELLAQDLVPFMDAAARGVPFIMVGHISVPNVTGDDVPASLSRKMVTDILRTQLGYDGIIITDAMDMGAIVTKYSIEDAAVTAVNAGCDVLLVKDQFLPAYRAVLQAVNDGTIPAERLDDALRRILRAKLSLTN